MTRHLEPWINALLDSHAVFEMSLLGLSGRLRMRPGWELSLGSLPDHLFYFVAEGGFDARFEGREGRVQRVTTGDLVWMGRGTPVSFRLREGDSLVVWRFRLRAIDGEGRALDAPRSFLHLSPARHCESWIDGLVDEAGHNAPFKAERVRGLLLCLMTELLRVQSEQSAPAHTLSRAQRANLERYFAEHAARWPNPSDLAQVVELSPDYFTRCFRRTYGVPPRKWLLQERQRQAAVRLLESNLQVTQIARELGYDDVFLFSRQFKAVFGLSPARYRQQHGGIERL